MPAPILASLFPAKKREKEHFKEEEITFRYVEGRDNTLDYGIRGGVGFEIVTTVGMFQAEGSYNFGLASILEKDITPIPTRIQNQAVVISIGYLFMFKQ